MKKKVTNNLKPTHHHRKGSSPIDFLIKRDPSPLDVLYVQEDVCHKIMSYHSIALIANNRL